MTQNDGGPAFPQFDVAVGERDGHGDAIEAHTISAGGMSLRDYFAGQVLAGLCADLSHHRTFKAQGEVAESAYSIADTMIEVRGK